MKILIVEDEAGILSFLKQGLEEEGYSIETAEDGMTGFQLSTKERFDLIILDWMLPKMDGKEFCEKFRAKDQKTPIIFLTAKDSVQDTILGLKAGANDYVKKPFHFEELLERIKVQLRNSEEAGEILSIGTIRLNSGSYEVFKEDEQISLTQREFDLLKYLIQHQNQVCTRESIIKEVWNIHFDYDSSVIDVYINSLRKKLKLKSGEDHIHTIRGVGYMAKAINV